MRLVLALCAALVTLVGRAEAKVISCSCPAEIHIPAAGVTDLPRNAQQWTISDDAGTPIRSMTMNPSPFTGPRDDTPPETPRDVFVSVVMSQTGDPVAVDAISLFGHYTPDTAIIRIEIRDRSGAHTLWTTPHRLYLCFPGLTLDPGALTISIYALDVAGNESQPFRTTAETTIVAPADRDETCMEHRHHHGHGFEILGLMFLWLIFLVCWLVYLLGRRAGAMRGLAEDVPVLVAEEIVRRLLRWQVVWTAMLALAIFGLYAADDDMALISVMIAPVGIVAFCRLIVIHYASRLLRREEASATRYGRWLCIQTLRDSQLVRASDADFVAGKRASLPRSVAR